MQAATVHQDKPRMSQISIIFENIYTRLLYKHKKAFVILRKIIILLKNWKILLILVRKTRSR